MPPVAQSSRVIGLWLSACALCAVAGFWAGRQPSAISLRERTPEPSAPRQAAPGSIRVTGSVASADTAYDRTPPSEARRRVLIDLLQRLEKRGARESLGDMIKLAGLVQTSGEDELAEALALGAEIAPEGSSSPLTEFLPLLVFTRWGEINGPAALEAYLALPAEQRSAEALPALFQSWAADGDPQDALDHALALRRTMPEDANIYQIDPGQILIDWDRRDPAAALAAARQLAGSTDGEQQAATRELAGKIALDAMRTKDAGAALRWIDEWPDASGRDALRLRLLDQLDTGNDAQTDDTARIIAAIQSSDTLADSSYLNSYARRIASSDIGAAQRWCATLPPAARADSARIIAEKLADSGRWREAVSWVDRQTTDSKTRSATYWDAAVAAAKEGELAAAMSLSERATPESPFAAPVIPLDSPPSHADLLAAWMHGDPSRSELLLRHALSLDPAALPAMPTPAP